MLDKYTELNLNVKLPWRGMKNKAHRTIDVINLLNVNQLAHECQSQQIIKYALNLILAYGIMYQVV